MILKASKSVFRRKNMNPNDYVHCCVIGCHANLLLHFGLNKKATCEGLLGEGIKSILQHLYLNAYAEFDCKISYIMFLHDNHLACEISTVRNLARFNRSAICVYTVVGVDRMSLHHITLWQHCK